MNEWILELSLNGEVLRMKAFDQNSKALTNVLVHCAILYLSSWEPSLDLAFYKTLEAYRD